MPKLGVEPIRRQALVKATITEIGAAGSLDVTVSKIARRAGMSSALAHHYFGGKEQILLAAMRHILVLFADEVRSQIASARTPAERLDAILRASFASPNFTAEVIAAWLNFYVLAQANPEALRLLTVYRRRLQSNLTYALRPMVGAAAADKAEVIGALIDGVYIRQSLRAGAMGGDDALAMLRRTVDHMLPGADQRKTAEMVDGAMT
ncbi:transcriptional regulator BetI [Litorivita pollutaquae]|uniref:HTH-type transcriptional regulator BetI n=1 Tax=Litorivita pollutaquae TaxID=2200892 RepID=A0A2V4NFX0_9RHOB|nr:transcriptional regulator BetI [Litorivita pollutaquae]PYC48890.1 transcriptional regulator BetI [Litorivita pollutaquae]